MAPKQAHVDVTPSEPVTTLTYSADAHHRLGICLILAHGAGANQTSAFMVRFPTGLAARGIDTVTFNFVYTEHGKRLPDRNDKLEACYRKVIEAVQNGILGETLAQDRLAIGGKSMGGRIASQVAAAKPDGVAGLVFLGYPLHPPGRPEQLRSKHLPAIQAPMLFVQGSRDAFGAPEELTQVFGGLQTRADLFVVDGGDHSFKVPKKAAIPQEAVYESVLDEIGSWLIRTLGAPQSAPNPRAQRPISPARHKR
jgi:predicted alpha/beta-hydrolase family hydrolase